MFLATVGSSKSVYEHEQLSVEETLMPNVITRSEAACSNTVEVPSTQLPAPRLTQSHCLHM